MMKNNFFNYLILFYALQGGIHQVHRQDMYCNNFYLLFQLLNLRQDELNVLWQDQIKIDLFHQGFLQHLV